MLSQSNLNNMCNKSIYQRVVIVGASSGIGLEVARLFVNAGCMVGLAARRLSLIHISEPTRPLYISYAVFCLKKLLV